MHTSTLENLKAFVQQLEEQQTLPTVEELDIAGAFRKLKALKVDYHLDVSLRVCKGKPELEFQVYVSGSGVRKPQFFDGKTLAVAVSAALQWQREQDAQAAADPVEAMQAALAPLLPLAELPL